MHRPDAIIRPDVLRLEPDIEHEFAITNHIDRDLGFGRYADGPVFRSLSYFPTEVWRYRRLGFWYYSESFYNEAARIAIDHEGRSGKVQEKIIRLCTSELATLQPKYIIVWDAILRVVFSSRTESNLFGLLDIARGGGEFETATVHSSVYPTFPLVGQVGQNRQKSKKQDHASPYQEQLSAIHVVRGSCGSALLVNHMLSEPIHDSGVLYMGRYPKTKRNSARPFVAYKVGPLL